jgi:hypothetical protein
MTLAASAPTESRSVPVALTVTIRRPDGTATQLAETVQVRDVLIASIGDSFASGEGNPDRPTDWSFLKAQPNRPWGSDLQNRWLGRGPQVKGVGEPHWWDAACHRSFYSQHLIAALK